MDKSGNVYVTGYTNNYSNVKCLTVKYNSSLVFQSSAVFDISSTKGNGIAVDNSGNVYVAGYSNNGMDTDYLTLKYNSSLVLQSSATFDSGSYEEATDIAVDNFGNVYLTGISNISEDNLIVKYNSSLVFQSSAVFDNGTDNWGEDIVVDNLGNVYVTGDWCTTLKYNSSLAFQSSVTFTGGGVNAASGIALDNSGNVYITGSSDISGSYDFLTVKYSSSLVFQSYALFDSGSPDTAYGIAIDSSNNVYVTGVTDANFRTIRHTPAAFSIAPVLSWTGETNYTSDGLDPQTGTSTTTFIYRVKYTDADNDTPADGYPKVYIQKNGSDIVGSPFTMTAADGNPCSAGRIYTTSTTLPGGTDLTYYFAAYDIWNATATGDPTDPPIDAPDVANNAPTLDWTGETNYTSDGLDPETGDSTTTFVYRVTYTDIDNDAPANGYPKVYIKKGGTDIQGSPFAMTAADGNAYSVGRKYISSTTLSGGTDYTYYFEAYDFWSSSASGTPTGPIDAPNVESPTLLEINPTSLNFGEIPPATTKTLTFTISNTGGGTLSGTINDDKDWISTDNTTFNSNSVTVSVTVNTTNLTPGAEYTGTVSIDSDGGNETVSVSVTPTCVIVFPNPLSLSSGKLLNFWGSGVPNCEIKIYTLSGSLVKTLKEIEGKDKIYWDVTNENGERIVRGIYLYTTVNPKEKNVGKFTVVR
ncbi:MAG: hypothetical protein AUJ85_03115 [Elusimicrobia bacterium CG1_02_37_114]|nr:MAG: hypothetical protein AUJ85_03115 [Elusimicrobia bacterium CG1_02_37_114]PIV53117.1 MAG: hypothetical protein COS17_05580 [Elusimicrobia bacterium CG02_land_8_20_14_3_00_37_13]PIZ14415.1 MAG: hypothetical protein COY53_00100 [Elusimicrobia bacterium CG_4_10_14_0_8_um_filter_37_32]